mgnify:CR=1 FL=1
MAKIVWDETGKHFYETGVKNGVLYVRDDKGAYPMGVAWNGLTAVTESPSGAEATAKAYTDEVAGVYASEGVEAAGLRKEIAERDAATLASAKAYTDELANGQVAANTAALATVDSRIATAKGEAISEVKGDAVDYDTLGKVEAKLDAIDLALEGVDGAAVKSVTGTGYVEVNNTDAQNPVVSVKTGAVADGADVLATAADVKSYVDTQITESWMWEEFGE